MGLGLGFRELSEVPYEPIQYTMQRFVAERDKSVMDEAWLSQHLAALIQGQVGRAEHVLFPGNTPVIQVDRGGQVTYHDPGQLVTYPLLDVRHLELGVRELVSRTEQSLIGLLISHDVQAVVKSGAPGIYVDGAKTASPGPRARNGYSFHGLVLNLSMDLQPFQRADPCGYAGMSTTQLRDLVGPVGFAEVCTRLRAKLISRPGYAEQKTLASGIKLIRTLLRRGSEEPSRARWKSA